MNEKYNLKISQISGLFLQLSTEIQNDNNLKIGEKFLILQQLASGIAPAIKKFDNLKKEIEEWAKNSLKDSEDGKSKEVEFEGASIFVKYSYPKPIPDTDKLLIELERAYIDLNISFKKTEFMKESTPRKTVVVQTILNK